jgi:VanZ like family
MDFLRYVPVPLLAAIVAASFVVAIIAAAVALRAHDRAAATKRAARALLVGALVAILAVTLPLGGSRTGVNLVPFRGIAEQLGNLNPAVGALNILGNAFMFVPAGLLAAFALGWGVRRTTLAGLALSVAIEVTQLALGRSADIDDVILNSAGAAAGAAVAVAAAVLVRRRSHERQTRRPRAHTGERP